MKFQIVYDRPGRLRVRAGQYAFSEEQGYGIVELLEAVAGVHSAVSSAVNGSLLIEHEPSSRAAILELLRGLERDALPVGRPGERDSLKAVDDEFHLNLARMVMRRLFFKSLLPPPVRTAITLYRACGYWRQGLGSLLDGRLDVAVLDAASIGAAMVQKSTSTAGSIMFLLRLSGLLEDYTRKRTKSALTHSLAVNVDSAWLVREDGVEVSVPVSSLRLGDRIVVRMGAMLPVDGVVVAGEAMLNEATMTGESLPVMKQTGTSVYAGTLVEEGAITLRITALADDSRINKIISMIEDSEALKADVQNRAERLADAIVPYSFFGAVAVGLLTRNLTRALSVLMVDYSCAIKLSTPICIISAMREAASHKIMVKGGRFLEEIAAADAIIFDKTGTLTVATPKVAKVLAFGKYSKREVLRTAACLEEHFPHSMARAVVDEAARRELKHEEEHAEVQYVVAHGVSTTLHGEKAIIGSAHFVFDDEGTHWTAHQQEVIAREIDGCSALYLAIGGRLAGVICIEDPPRAEAAAVIAELRSLGIERIIMLTGDHEAAAQSVSAKLGIDEYRAQVLPDDKSNLVQAYRDQGYTVVMVGDGINDSPALAAANVSVAMKDSSDIAREVADVTLLSADLSSLTTLRQLSRGMIARINHNYNFIVSFNTSLLLLGLVGVISPQTAALLHNLSTMGIGIGSMRSYLPPQE